MLQTAHKPTVTVLHRSPFTLGTPDVWHWPADQTIAQIVKRTPLPDKADFERRGIVLLNGCEVFREFWHLVRPRADRNVVVTLHMPVRGGSGGGGGAGQGKQTIALVAAIAITIASAGAAGGLFAGVLGASFAQGTLGATLLGAAISFAGSILVSSLSSAPVRSQDASDTGASGGARLEPAAVQGNQLRPNSPVPAVIGTRRIFPPFAAEPTPEYVGQDEVVHALFCLAGPHKLELPRFGDTAYNSTDTDKDIQLQLYDGLSGSTVPTYPSRYSRTFSANIQLSTHNTDPQNLAVFAPPLPVWHGTNTADSPDECWLHFSLYGLLRNSSPSDPLRIPIRIRMRRRGSSTWRDLPELHYMDATQSQRRIQVKLKFGEAFLGPFPQPSVSRGFVEARKNVPAQNVSPAGAVWNADSYFSKGAGNDIYSATTYATTNVVNVDLQPDTATIYLDSSWTPGIYEIEIKRGATFRNADFVSSAYTYGGSVIDFYGSRDTGVLPLTHDGLVDKLDFVRAVSVINSPPIQFGDLSLMYVKATNRQVGNFSVQASRYVYDWDGSGWNTRTTTSNPAPHYRDMLTGTLNFDALPEIMLDDNSLIDWRNACASAGYRCDLVVEGGPIFETLRMIASCGFARPAQSETWGVVRDYDRSAEAPVQIFSPRNSRNFGWQKAYPRLPDGLLINFRDEDSEYTGRQLVVYRPGGEQLNARTEQITYDGLVDRDQVIARAKFDLRQSYYRAALYQFEAPVESIVCRRGSLVGINHDVITQYTGAARIADIVRDSSGLVTELYLDGPIDIYSTSDMHATANMHAVTDVHTIGLTTAVAVRKADGTSSIHDISGASTSNHVIFSTAYFDNQKIKIGCLLITGLKGQTYKRLIVSEIAPGQDLTATLTLVDEAPELWAA